MSEATFIQRHNRAIYLIGGLLLGAFLGYTAPRFSDPEGGPLRPTPEQVEAHRAHLDVLQTGVKTSLEALSVVDRTQVTLTVPSDHPDDHVEAVVVLWLAADSVSNEQITTISELVCAAVDGLDWGHLTLVDQAGRVLNLDHRLSHERKMFWTGIAINVAKILGILAALIVLKYIIRMVGRLSDA